MYKKIFILIFLTLSFWTPCLLPMEEECIPLGGENVAFEEGSSSRNATERKFIFTIGQEKQEKTFDVLESVVKEIKVLNRVLDFPQEGEEDELQPQAIDSLFPDREAHEENQNNFEKILKLLEKPGSIKDTLSTYSIEELLSLLKCVHKLDVPEILEEGTQVCADYIQNQEEIGDELQDHLEKLQSSNSDLFDEIMSKINFMLLVPHNIIPVDEDKEIRHVCFNKTATKIAFCTSDNLYIVRCKDNKVLQKIRGKCSNLQFMNDDKLFTVETETNGMAESRTIWVWEFFDDGTRKIVHKIPCLAAVLTPDDSIIIIEEMGENNQNLEENDGLHSDDLQLRQIDKNGNYCNDHPLFLSNPGLMKGGLITELSPDGRFIALASLYNAYVYLWELKKLDGSKVNEPIIIFRNNKNDYFTSLKKLFFDTKKCLLYIIAGKSIKTIYAGSFDEKKLGRVPNIVDYATENKLDITKLRTHLSWDEARLNRAEPLTEFATFDKPDKDCSLYETATCFHVSPDGSRVYAGTFPRNSHSHSLYSFNFNKRAERRILYLPSSERVARREIRYLPSGEKHKRINAIFSFDISKDRTLLAAGTAGKLIVWKFLGGNTIEMSPSTLPLLHALNKAHSANEKLHLCPYSNPSLYSIYNESNSDDLSHFVNPGCSLKCYLNSLKEKIKRRPLLSALGATAACASGYLLYKKFGRTCIKKYLPSDGLSHFVNLNTWRCYLNSLKGKIKKRPLESLFIAAVIGACASGYSMYRDTNDSYGFPRNAQ